MLDHIGIVVSDYARAKDFYTKALAPLGFTLLMEFGEAAGIGPQGKPLFWLSPGKVGGSLHIAFEAPDRATVRAFYEAAMAAGGKDNGGPGLRPHYHPNYYGAFVFDPDGHNIEAVCHRPE